ncbi:MAG TPA: molybdopterin-dependent oxidoreductase, partial [Thermoanaerobaculia bacterium]|nr:molybdopterin-dependent oxidoreductase [Thermoanaerobaculia bacterium]
LGLATSATVLSTALGASLGVLYLAAGILALTMRRWALHAAVAVLVLDRDDLPRRRHDGQDLPREHGGPCRLVLPKLYFWKSAKWIRAFEFLDANASGFWEVNGYHLHADPWKEERYSDEETDAMQRMRAEAARRLRDQSK